MERLSNYGVSPVVSPSVVSLPGDTRQPPFLHMTESALNSLENQESQALFTGLFQRPEFKFGLLKLREHLQHFPETRSFSSPETRMKFDDLGHQLAGLFFECIAHDFIGQEFGQDQILLSSWQTDALYRWRFRRRRDQFNEHDGFRLSISGITVPDGILFDMARNSSGDDELVINSFCEYSLSIRTDRKLFQAEHYRSPEIINDLFPFHNSSIMLRKKLSTEIGIPQKIRFIRRYYQGIIHVLPKPKDDQEEEFINERLRGGEVFFAPFTSFEFGKVLIAIIDDVAGEVGVDISRK